MEPVETTASEPGAYAQLVRSAFEAVRDAMIAVDEHGRVIAASAAARALLGEGTTVEALEGDLEIWSVTPAVRLPPDRRPLARAMAGATLHEELRITPRSGVEPRTFRVSAHPVLGERGTVAIVATYHEVTSERAFFEKLVLSHRMAAIGRLAAGIAHEINNPLAAVVANLDLMNATFERGVPDAESFDDARDMLGDALVGVQRVRAVVRDFATFSRHDDEPQHGVDVAAVLDSTLRIVRNEIKHRARLVLDLEPLPLVAATEARLGHAFLNLLSNTLRSIEPGAADRNEIEIRGRRIGNEHIRLELTDTGSGVAARAIQIAQRIGLCTTDEDGISAAIAHRIVLDVGGTLELRPRPSGGLVTEVTLPVVSTAREPVARPSPAVASRTRVLVIDDEALVGTAITRVLARDHDVQYVGHARDAVQQIQAGARFDIILCDLMMPHMTGKEFYEAVVPYGQAANIIFVTGGAFTYDAREFLEHIPNRMLEKPFDASKLRSMIGA